MVATDTPKDGKSSPVTQRFGMFHKIDRISASAETGLNIVGVTFIMILMVMTAFEIVGRYLFNTPIPGYLENTELLMAAIVFLGIGFNQRVGAHIRMDLLINKLKGRAYHISEVITQCFSLIIIGSICIYSFFSTLEAYQMGDVTEYLFTPTWPSKLCVPLGCFFLCVRLIIQIIKGIARAIAGNDDRKLE